VQCNKDYKNAGRKKQGLSGWEADGGEGLKQRIADALSCLLMLAACLEEENEHVRE
jgi:hypothetical protein